MATLSMTEPTQEELNESINELLAYKDRLNKEVVRVAKKLRMPQKKIESTLSEHIELNQVKELISKLIEQRDEKRGNC